MNWVAIAVAAGTGGGVIGGLVVTEIRFRIRMWQYKRHLETNDC